MAAANERRDQVLSELRARHEEYLKACGPMFSTRPFRAARNPGWVYLPVEDCVILEETYRFIQQSGRPDAAG